MQPASVPSSPNPRRIRPYQPRRCSSQGLVLSRPYSSLSMKGAEKHRFPAVREVEERTTSAGWRHDISRFDGGCPCSPLRRALPVCSRAEQTALGTQSGCAPRWRPRARLTARTAGRDRPSTAGCAWKSAICLKQGADAVTRFILITIRPAIIGNRLKKGIMAGLGRRLRAPPPPEDWTRGPIWKRRAA